MTEPEGVTRHEPETGGDSIPTARGRASQANEGLGVRRPLAPIPGGWLGRPLAEMRWMLEAGRLLIDPVAYGRDVTPGDGRSVVLLPGFLAGDSSLWMLSQWLRLVGYRSVTIGLPFNVDCSDRIVDRVESVVVALHETSRRRVAVVGHSRGGHFARALGARRPDLISHAVSLGADLQGLYGISSPTRTAIGIARTASGWARRRRSPMCFRTRCTCQFLRDYAAPFPVEHVRLTSIYSKGDGVVRWERAIVEEATCLEVSGSHIGLIANRKAYTEIGRALAEPELPWR
jgi:triacylglycerol lipase